jgi:tetratricopeptide (TPR) repeat protein
MKLSIEIHQFAIIKLFVEQQTMIKLYRAMRVSCMEGNRLRSCSKGTILSINSFVSTSRSLTVAMTYLGTDLERDVRLEILIDKTLHDSSSSPFADISTVSAFPDEEEVLLSMGTTLQVQSVTSNPQKKNTCIQVRLCFEEDAGVKELKSYILKELPYERDEQYYISTLANLLALSGDYEKLGQIMKFIRPGSENVLTEVHRSFIRSANSIQHSDNDEYTTSCFLEMLSKLSEMLQDLDSRPNTPNDLRDLLSSLVECHTILSSSQIFHGSIATDGIWKQLMSMISSIERSLPPLSYPSPHPVFPLLQCIKGTLCCEQDRYQQAMEHFEVAHASSTISILDNNNSFQQMFMISMAQSAAALGYDDRSLQILEGSHTLERPQIRTLLELANYHKTHEDLPMAIAYYRAVIEECNLPPNSIEIVDAYCSIGSAFHELKNTELALSNYHQARDLLLQHHSPTHPRLTQLQHLISLEECCQQLEQLLKNLGQNWSYSA